MKKVILLALVLLLMSIFLVTGASAALKCVGPYPGCSSTIQNAVTAAGSGDSIIIFPGVYYENVQIPSSLSNLAISGGTITIYRGRVYIRTTTPEQVVVDARPITGECSGPAFWIQDASHVTIQNLTVRHACAQGGGIVESPSYGYGANGYPGANIYSTGDFTKIDKVNSYASGDEGVLIEVNFGNQTAGNFTEDPSYCLNASGSAIVQNSLIVGNQGTCAVAVMDNNAIVQSNTIWNNSGCGIYADGCKPTITKNDLRQNMDYDQKFACIYLDYESHYAQVTSNTIYECGDTGIALWQSFSPTISSNTIKGIGGYTPYLIGIVEKPVFGIPPYTDSGCFFGAGILAGEVYKATINNNTISGTLTVGIALQGYDSTVSGNILTAPGFVGIGVGYMGWISGLASGRNNAGGNTAFTGPQYNGNRITSNKVDSPIVVGIVVEGGAINIQGNEVANPAYIYLNNDDRSSSRNFGQLDPGEMYGGYFIECYSSFSSGGVADNKVINSGWNGFVISAFECNITNNTADNITNNGFFMEIHNGSYVTNNNARYCGSSTYFEDSEEPAIIGWDSNGFDIWAYDSYIKGNLAEYNAGRGFLLGSIGTTFVENNTSRKNLGTGVRIEYASGADTLLFKNNTITDNHGEGLANFGPNDGGTINIQDNTALRNRTDICNEGTINLFTGNTYSTGGPGDDCDLEGWLPY